ncbi:MAG: flavodoxin domain-containing protein, partial [Cetobacterium sp.]
NWASFTPEEEGVVIVYGTLYGTTAKMANVIARELSWNGIKNIKIYDASKTDHSYIISDIWKYKGLIIGSAAHNNDVYPVLQGLLHKLKNYGLKNRYLGIFGNMLWSGGGVRGIQSFADALPGLEIIAESVEAKGEPTPEDQKRLENIAKAMAEKLKSERQ